MEQRGGVLDESFLNSQPPESVSMLKSLSLHTTEFGVSFLCSNGHKADIREEGEDMEIIKAS